MELDGGEKVELGPGVSVEFLDSIALGLCCLYVWEGRKVMIWGSFLLDWYGLAFTC